MADSNRVKRLRNITVNGVDYKWLTSNWNCDGDYNYQVSIWDQSKILVYREIHGNVAVTPKTVRDIILEL